MNEWKMDSYEVKDRNEGMKGGRKEGKKTNYVQDALLKILTEPAP